MQKPLVSLLGLILGLVLHGAPAARAQQSQDVTPYIGETKAQFEARKAGLPPPPAVPAAASVTIFANPRGNFFVNSTVNNTAIRMVVDTGADYVALSERDARSAGIELEPADFKVRVATANGTVLAAPIVLKEIAVGEITVDDVPAIVVPETKLSVSLLGMSFLSKLSYFNESDGKLTLRR
jgi:aspartyl protease family protein